MPFEIDRANWSGEGTFTHLLLERLTNLPGVRALRIEDAPATRSEADYQFISNELFVDFVVAERLERYSRFGFLPATRAVAVKTMTLADLETALAGMAEVGEPDYSDAGMLQYLRTERIV